MVGKVPEVIADFGTVILLKPADLASPVTVKDKVVFDWFVVIISFDIWALVMFLLRARSISPLSAVASAVTERLTCSNSG